MIDSEEAQAAAELLDELESSRLEVILIPQRYRTNEGGCVRCAISKNASWYRRFCAAYTARRFKKDAKGKRTPHTRRNAAPDTLIKRQAVIRALTDIENGRSPEETVYGRRLAPIIALRVRHAANPF